MTAFGTGPVVLDDAAIDAARAELTAAERFLDGAYEYGTDADVDEANARIVAARAALDAVAIPDALRARKLPNALVQDAENRAVEARAIATAAARNEAIWFRPFWMVDGVDDSMNMLAWPNGEIQDEISYQNETRRSRLAANPYL